MFSLQDSPDVKNENNARVCVYIIYYQPQEKTHLHLSHISLQRQNGTTQET